MFSKGPATLLQHPSIDYRHVSGVVREADLQVSPKTETPMVHGGFHRQTVPITTEWLSAGCQLCDLPGQFVHLLLQLRVLLLKIAILLLKFPVLLAQFLDPGQGNPRWING